MFYKGKSVEVIVDVLPSGKLPAESLAVYRRSSHLRLIQSQRRGEPHRSLRNVDPKDLWDFPGHESIRSDWFKHLLMFDSGGHELVIDAVLVEDAKIGREPEVKYESGEFVIRPGTRLVVGEEAMVWTPDPSTEMHEAIAEWRSVVDLKSRKVS